MIEITHKQAQHLIRQGIDRRLPDEQWAALQAHLERCPDCTAYRQRLNTTERRLNHALHLRWGGARGPVIPVDRALIDHRRRRAKLRKLAGRAVWVVLGALLVFGYIGYRRLTAPPPEPARQAAERPRATQRSVEPTQAAVTFRGLAAFASRRDGNAEIYLLNASGGRADLTNLTSDPAEDTHPAWSPDGEWIAFLSDRTGKNEVYALTVAGSRLTQLTSAPEVAWEGPLEWSADGQWIALSGRRGLGQASFLYLAPLNATPPRSIAYTRGAQPQARFSAAGPLLAYVPGLPEGGMQVLNINTGAYTRLVGQDPGTRFRAAFNGAYDWSLGGRGLVYTADDTGQAIGQPAGEASSMLRLTPEMDGTGAIEAYGRGFDVIDTLPGAGTFRAVSWVPNSLQVAALHDDDGDGCLTLRINHAYNRQVAPRDIRGLCVTGGLERSNWTGDGSWLVLEGRAEEDETPGIYAVRLQDVDAAGNDRTLIERLADADAPAAPEEPPAAPALRVRPSARSLAISPQAAPGAGQPAAAPQPTQLPPASAEGLPEWVYFTAQREMGRQVFRARPDGSQTEPLTPADRYARCLNVGPDGRVAYTLEGASDSQEIYVMDADGQNPRPLDYFSVLRGRSVGVPFSFYDCPDWSPDGQFLTFYIVFPSDPYLAILPTDGETPPTYVRIEQMSHSAPVWLPGTAEDPARRILLVYPQGSEPARLMELDLEQLPEGQAIVEDPGPALSTRKILTGWHDVWHLSLSPDQKALAALMVYYSDAVAPTGMTFAQMRVFDTQRMDLMGVVQINNFNADSPAEGGMGWLPDGSVALARTAGHISSQKTLFYRFDWRTNDLDAIAPFEDLVTGAAWTQQGWMIFAAESGLWALEYDAENPMPVQLNGELTSEVEWK